jgi:hypothetical protein
VGKNWQGDKAVNTLCGRGRHELNFKAQFLNGEVGLCGFEALSDEDGATKEKSGHRIYL